MSLMQIIARVPVDAGAGLMPSARLLLLLGGRHLRSLRACILAFSFVFAFPFTLTVTGLLVLRDLPAVMGEFSCTLFADADVPAKALAVAVGAEPVRVLVEAADVLVALIVGVRAFVTALGVVEASATKGLEARVLAVELLVHGPKVAAELRPR